MFRGLFLTFERLSHASDAARLQAILGAIGASTVLAYAMYAVNVHDNGARARKAVKVQQELRIHMK